MDIQFDERLEAPLPKPYYVTIKQVIREGLKRFERTEGELSISFIAADEMRDLNNKYRGLDKPTDVLSFRGIGDALGDIVICAATAEAQAAEFGHSLERELAFLAVHGLLHLIGFDHENPGEEAEMLKTQEEILSKVGINR